MYNCHKLFEKFYDDRVYLPVTEKNKLREFRDTNLVRVKEGTNKLSTVDEKVYPKFVDNFDQGSMAMHTINQSQNEEDQDIDHALIYEMAEIHESPEEARQFVANAINATTGNFSREPEARTNAVTVYYQDGYHVDFAIYRRKSDFWGNYTYEHAGGTSWTPRDPHAITEWFNKENRLKSPDPTLSFFVNVRKGQVRRIVRIIKFWAKSRSSWSLPSGLVITALVIECYVADSNRDDLALYNTLKAMQRRLQYDKDVKNPINDITLLVKDKDHKQLQSLIEKLDTWMPGLEDLKVKDCTEIQAKQAWGKFFRHDWWGEQVAKSRKLIAALADSQFNVKITISGRNNRVSYVYDPNGKGIIPKNMDIKFKATTDVKKPYEIKWEVRNEGDEAFWARNLNPRKGGVDESDQTLCKEESTYRGDHLMICKLIKDSKILHEQELEVRIR